MDYNIYCVFLLGFYRGLLKKKWDSIGITDDHRQKEVGILEGFQKSTMNFLRDSKIFWLGFYGILWDSVFLVISAALPLTKHAP